jgi:hypothetical protein
VRERWLSRRAIFLHLAFILFVPFCVWATWWQISRAEDGNDLSYLYTFEWPVFALLGLYFWWMFLHTDYEKVGLRGMKNQSAPDGSGQEAGEVQSVKIAAAVTAASPAETTSAPDESPELAAYNARLAALSTQGAKTWRRPETHIARRSR